MHPCGIVELFIIVHLYLLWHDQENKRDQNETQKSTFDHVATSPFLESKSRPEINSLFSFDLHDDFLHQIF